MCSEGFRLPQAPRPPLRAMQVGVLIAEQFSLAIPHLISMPSVVLQNLSVGKKRAASKALPSDPFRPPRQPRRSPRSMLGWFHMLSSNAIDSGVG